MGAVRGGGKTMEDSDRDEGRRTVSEEAGRRGNGKEREAIEGGMRWVEGGAGMEEGEEGGEEGIERVIKR